MHAHDWKRGLRRQLLRGLIGTAGAAVAVGTAATGCTVSDQPNYMIAPQINHMAFSKAVESQSESALEVLGAKDGKGGRTLLVPPEGTVRRGFQPLHYDVTPEAAVEAGGEFVDDKGKPKLAKFQPAQAKRAGEELKNPFADSKDPAVLKRGEEVFTTFCSPCHGVTGMGDGLVAKKGLPQFPLAKPGVNAAKNPDGWIFHIVTYGRNMMGSYASQMRVDDRWKAIVWLRELQKRAASGAQGGK